MVELVLSERRRRFPQVQTMTEAYAVRLTVPPSAEVQESIDDQRWGENGDRRQMPARSTTEPKPSASSQL